MKQNLLRVWLAVMSVLAATMVEAQGVSLESQIANATVTWYSDAAGGTTITTAAPDITVYISIEPDEGYWTCADELNGEVEKIASLSGAGSRTRSIDIAAKTKVTAVVGAVYQPNGAGIYQVTLPALAEGQTVSQISKFVLTGTVTACTDISGATIAAESKVYNSEAQTASSYTVVLSGTTLTKDKEYAVTTNEGGTNVGSYPVAVTGIGHYKGTASNATAFAITKAAGSISYATTSVSKTFGDASFTNELTNTGDGAVSYESDNTAVATVDASTGEVTVVGNGEATIKATVADGINYTYETKTVSYKIEVSAPDPTPDPTDIPTVPVEATDAENEEEKVDDVTMNMVVVEGSETREEERTVTSPETGEEETQTVNVVEIKVDHIDIPDQDETTEGADKKEITVYVPATITSEDGKTVYEVTEIGPDAVKSTTETAVVVAVVLPETETPLKIADGALKVDDLPADNPEHRVATIISPVELLDDYALNASLQENFEAEKVKATVTPPNKYWTFSSGVDVIVPEGVGVYTCEIHNETEVQIVQIEDTQLMLNGRRVIKANNGVLVACVDGSDGNAYNLVASPGNQESGTTPATYDAKDYGENLLEPVIEAKNYAADDYYVLKSNAFHAIKANDSKVPATKAVLHKPGATKAAARLAIRSRGDEGTTGINAVEDADTQGKVVVYDLQGRKVATVKQTGLYIRNGKKVVIK